MPSPLLGYNTNVRHHGKLFHIQTEDSGVTHGHIFTHLFADGGRIIATRKSSYAEWIGTDRYPAIVKKLMQAQHKAMFIALRDGLFDEDEIAGAKAFLLRPITLDDERGAPGAGTPPSSTALPSGTAPVAGSRGELDADALDRAAAAYLATTPSFATEEPTGDATIPGGPSPEPVPPRAASPSPASPAPASLGARPPSASPSRARLDPTPVANPIQAPRPAAARAPSGTFSAASPARPVSGQATPATAQAPARPAQAAGAVRTPSAPSPGRYQQTQPAASRPKAPSLKPPTEPSLFGADILSEKSLDEVIMSYLAEDLDEKD